jgi:hypothetical protein
MGDTGSSDHEDPRSPHDSERSHEPTEGVNLSDLDIGESSQGSAGQNEYLMSAYARKYGVSKDKLFRSFEQQKSGITPTSATFRGSEEMYRKERIEMWQRMALLGFSPRDLFEAGALSSINPPPKKNNLTNALHPLVDFPRWRSIPLWADNAGVLVPDVWEKAFLPLENGDGRWEMGNPTVREVMLPCLRLASRLLDDSSCNPW